MSKGGWRDGEGRTASERRSRQGAESRVRFLHDLRHRPLAALKSAAVIAGMGVLVLAFILWYW